jgi:hypothetical protein
MRVWSGISKAGRTDLIDTRSTRPELEAAAGVVAPAEGEDPSVSILYSAYDDHIH